MKVIGVSLYDAEPMTSDEARVSVHFKDRKCMLPEENVPGYLLNSGEFVTWFESDKVHSTLIEITGKDGIATLRDGQKFFNTFGKRVIQDESITHKTCQTFLNLLIKFVSKV